MSGAGGGELEEVIAGFSPVTLEELDERSALRRRVDTKYVVPLGRLPEIVRELSDSYDVLEIEGLRRFGYESVYFDTPGLRCFHDHVEGRRPRFKARSRFYRDTGACFFEVKVRLEDETIKRQCPYEREAHGALTDAARGFVEQTLRELAAEQPPEDLQPTLSTDYRRVTLGASDGRERVTIDLAVQLMTMDDRTVTLRDNLALVETKSERGEGPVDDRLRNAGCEPISISKYRLGVGLLLTDDPQAARNQAVRGYFA